MAVLGAEHVAAPALEARQTALLRTSPALGLVLLLCSRWLADFGVFALALWPLLLGARCRPNCRCLTLGLGLLSLGLGLRGLCCCLPFCCLLLGIALGAVVLGFRSAEEAATAEAWHRNCRSRILLFCRLLPFTSAAAGAGASRAGGGTAARARGPLDEEERRLVSDLRHLQRVLILQQLALEEKPLHFRSEAAFLCTLLLQLADSERALNALELERLCTPGRLHVHIHGLRERVRSRRGERLLCELKGRGGGSAKDTLSKGRRFP
mmetsp:Transcript_106186/g.216473  ORF Transcript_106186/g.216473 Transcript_106186/m.216473 type:complete len:266 (-) Transcript_106186:10-807(-)